MIDADPKNPFEATFAAVNLLTPHIEYFTQLVHAGKSVSGEHPTLDVDAVLQVAGLARVSLEFVVAVHRITSESES